MLRPTAKEVKIRDNYQIEIKFDNGEIRMFDVEKLFNRKPFVPLLDKVISKTVRTNGITVEWAEDIDICPDELYFDSVLIN